MKVVVVGGGVVGLACAFELHRAGSDVVVLERGKVGHGTSYGNTGWVCPSFTYPMPGPGIVGDGLRAALHRTGPLALRPGLDPGYVRWLWRFRRNCTRERWQAGVRALLGLNETTFESLDRYRDAGVSFELHDAGLLLAALGEKKLHTYVELFEELRSCGFRGATEAVAGQRVRELEPSLGAAVCGGVLAQIDRWVDPLSLTTGLAAWLRAHGVAVEEGVEVSTVSGSRIVTATGEIACDAAVVAAGPSSPALLQALGVAVTIAPARGYSVTFARDAAATPNRALYLAEALVGVSSYANAVRLAGVFELGYSRLEIERGRLGAMLKSVDPFFTEWCPSASQSLEEWVGLRPLTSDGLPLIGPSPRDPRVYVATGHGMLGVTLAPATATLLAPLVVRGESASALAPFSPARPA
ncbi:MAG: NAD(P)/FAD-dependent oxidoreductase [Gaiella sp.]